jgi:hypothetical protein
MPRVVITHAVVDIERWLKGKAGRAAAIESGLVGAAVTLNKSTAQVRFRPPRPTTEPDSLSESDSRVARSARDSSKLVNLVRLRRIRFKKASPARVRGNVPRPHRRSKGV